MFESFYRYVKDEKTLQRARKLLKEQRFEMECEIIEINQESFYRVYGTFFGRSPITAVLIINYERVYQFQCRCHTYYYVNHYCEHFICLLAAIDRYYQDHPISHTNHRLMQLMEKYVPDYKLAEMMKQNVRLIPNLFEEGNKLKVSYKIGEQKYYVIKNITEFVNRMKEHTYYSYGKNFGFTHHEKRLDEVSKRNYDLIQHYVEITDSLASEITGYYYVNLDVKKDITLTGKLLDDFFEINYPHAVGMTLSKDFDSCQLELMKKDQFYELSIPDYRIYSGKEYSYVVAQNCIYQVDRSFDELKEIFEDFSNRQVTVDEVDLPALYTSVLPRLKKKFELVTNFDDEKYQPVDARMIIKLDYLDEVTLTYELYYRQKEYRFNTIEDQSIRNLPLETRVSELIETHFMSEDQINYVVKNEESLLYMIQSGIDDLNALGVEVLCTDRFDRIRSFRKPNVNVGISLESNLLNFNIDIEGASLSEIDAIIRSYQAKKKYHRLKSGQFLILEDEQLDLLDELVGKSKKDLKALAEGNLHMPIYRSLYLDKRLEETSEIQYHPQTAFKKLIDDFDEIKNHTIPIPENLHATLRNYQVDGYEWLVKLNQYHFGGILADDMGLGKTLQMIALLLHEKGKSPYPNLIVTPASLVYNWESEIKRFAPDLSVVVIAGNQKERKKSIEMMDCYDVVVTSYDLLKRDITYYEECKFYIQVIDEAQFIKNANTIQTKAVKAIQAQNKFALSGTPIENRLSELWSIFDYLMSGFLYNYPTFRNEFETPIMKNQDEAALARLQKMIGPFILRRNKKEVLKDLPDKIEKVMYAKMENKQEEIYMNYAKRVKMSLAKESDESFKDHKIQILQELMRLRQLCCDPDLFLEGYKGESCKKEQCLELVQSGIEGNHKILIFSQFKSMLDILGHELTELGISYYMIVGETSKEKRIEYVNAFNQDNTPVFLISLKAGGTGLNLTAADIVIHYDPWWNEAAMNQATDRAHRIGQQNIVTVYKMIVKDTIEESILQLQESKAELASSILEGSTTSMSSLSKDDLLEILK